MSSVEHELLLDVAGFEAILLAYLRPAGTGRLDAQTKGAGQSSGAGSRRLRSPLVQALVFGHHGHLCFWRILCHDSAGTRLLRAGCIDSCSRWVCESDGLCDRDGCTPVDQGTVPSSSDASRPSVAERSIRGRRVELSPYSALGCISSRSRSAPIGRVTGTLLRTWTAIYSASGRH